MYRQAALADKERSLDRRRRQGLPLKVEDGSDPPTDLALRLRDRLPDYATWRPTLASALGLPATDLPCALVRGQCGEDLPTLSPGSSGLRTRGPESPGKRDVIRISSDASRPSPETTAQKRRAVSARNIDPGRPSDAQTSFSKIEEMSITLRAEKVRAMLVDLLREYAACYGPILVVLDDAHFFDSPSWRLLLGIQEELRNVVLCVIMLRPLIPYPIRQQISLTRSHSQGRGGGVGRHDTLQWNQGLPITWLEPRSPKQRSGPPQDGPDPAITKLLREYYAALLALGDTECLVLRGFTLTETQSYMDMMMDGAKTSLEAAQLFWGKSNGLPSFLHQVMVYMRHRVRQVYELGEPVPDAWSVVRGALTYVRSTVSIHSVVPARMDRLRPDEQLTLKVASVMGVTVDEELLRACHPKRPSARRIAADMRALRTAGFLSKDPGGAPGMWHWNDILARDAVYDVLPATQCAELHARLAAAMEAQERNGEHILPLSTIAFHWRASCQLHVATEVRGQNFWLPNIII